MSDEQLANILNEMWEQVKPGRRYPDGTKMQNTQWCQGAQWAIEKLRMAQSGRNLAEAMQLRIEEQSNER